MTAVVESTYWTWIGVRAALHRGYWLITSLYLVVEAGLEPFQLVLMGTVMGVTSVLAEVPTGVFADTVSRRGSILIGHVLVGAGMVMTGLVDTFAPLAVTQVLWGLGWTFFSGADVAWVSDELDDPVAADRVLTTGARWEQIGAAVGMVGFGALAWATSLAVAIVTSGSGMALLGLFVVLRFTETGFAPVATGRWRRSGTVLGRGVDLARHDHVLRAVFVATFLLHGAGESFDRLYPRRLVDTGLPEGSAGVVTYTLLGVVSLAAAAVVLGLAEHRMTGAETPRRLYVGGCAVAVVGLLVLAHVPDHLAGMAGVVLVGGVGWSVTRTASVVWVNRRATSEVRATVQSMLTQSESLGEIVLGVVWAVVAQRAGIPAALTAGAVVVGLSGVVALRARDRAPLPSGT